MREKCTTRKGFSLIELLVVIAIIAILAAILFPVFNTVRENTRRTTCMSQMQAIGQAVKIYYEDNRKYPDVLMCIPYITSGSSQSVYTGTGSPLAPDQVLARPLIKQRLTTPGKDTFRCPDNLSNVATAVTTAVYPPKVPRTGQVMLNSAPAYFYTIDSYDIGPALDSSGQAVQPFTYELHYSKDWTGALGANDPQNQLKYPNPPQSTTVITWCSYHAAVAHSNQMPVLMLDGRVKSTPVNQFQNQGPLAFIP